MTPETMPDTLKNNILGRIIYGNTPTERALALCALHLSAQRTAFGLATMPAELYGFALTRWPVQMDAVSGRPDAVRAGVIAECARVDLMAITNTDLRAAVYVNKFLSTVATFY